MEQEGKKWDCIVIGAGVIGLSTAYSLTKAGLKPLVLEQFNLPHTRGSSHSESRLIRRAHVEDVFAALSTEAYEMWKYIEKDADQQLMITTGLVLLEKGDGQGIKNAGAAMARLNIGHEYLNGKQLQRKYPMARYSEDYKGILDKTASIVFSDRVLKVLAKLVQNGGGVIKDGYSVKSIRPGAMVTVETNKGVFTSKKLVIATGPWSKDVLQNLGLDVPLKTMPGLHMYWKTSSPAEFSHTKFFPVLEEETTTENNHRVYVLFPQIDDSGMIKVVTRGYPPPFYCHPNDRDKQSMQSMVDVVSEYIKQHYPTVESKPSIIEPCMYCMSPDRMAVIDHHPNFPNIVIGTAFSGRGFILAPLAGKILSDMVQEKKPHWSLKHFSMKRFNTQSKL